MRLGSSLKLAMASFGTEALASAGSEKKDLARGSRSASFGPLVE